jgi:hypothetical protein
MHSAETATLRSFGRAFRIVEALVKADLLDETKNAANIVFGDSPEYRLVNVLTNAQQPLPLCEVRVRCRAGRRAVLREGRVRLSLERMERFGVVINVGSHERPRYQMNLLDDKAKLLMSIFTENATTRLATMPPSALSVHSWNEDPAK